MARGGCIWTPDIAHTVRFDSWQSFPADTRNEYHEAMRAVGNGGVEFDDDLERYVVFAGPGDIL